MANRFWMHTRAAGLAFVALAAVLSGGREALHAQSNGLPVGSRPPSFTVKTLQGTSLDPTRQRGKVVVLDFWATWCPPCRKSIPVLQAMHNKYRSQGLMVVGVSDETRAQVAPFAAQNKMTYPLGTDSAAARQYKVTGIPTMVILDKKGVIRMYEVGFDPNASRARLETMVKKLLAERA